MGPLFTNYIRRRQFSRIGACLSMARCLSFILLLAITGSVSAQNPAEEECVPSSDVFQVLTGSMSVKRELSAKEKHVYQVALTPGQYIHAVVDQKGIDVVVTLFDPNQSLLVKRDSPNSKFGPEKVSTVASLSGNYSIVVCGAGGEPVGSYELKLDGPRAPTAGKDDRRVVAELAYFHAVKTLNQGGQNAVEEAIEYYGAAATIWSEVGDPNEEGYALINIGELYRGLKQFKESESNLDTALLRLRTANDLSGQAYALNSIGATYRDLGPDGRKGLERYQEAIVLRQRMGDRWGEAQSRNNLGLLYSNLGLNAEAFNHLNLAYALWRELRARGQEMNTLNNIGRTNLHTGNLMEAHAQFQEVLNYCAEMGGPCRLEPYARNSLGVIYDTWGQPNEAVNQYNQALTLFRQSRIDIGDQQATTLDNLGLLLVGLEDVPAALEKFNEALALRLQWKNPGMEALTRSNLGLAYVMLGRFPLAFEHLNKALVLSHGTDQRYEAYSLQRLGYAHFKNNETAKALERYGQALELQTKIGDVRGQAITLNQIAELYNSIDQAGNARRDYRKAQQLWNEVGDPQGEATSLYGLARVERQQKKLPEARAAIVEAIAKVESGRTGTSNFRLRRTFFEGRHDYYELLTDIHMQVYYSLLAKKNFAAAKTELELALFAAERARSRNLLDLLNERQSDIRQGVDPKLLARELSQRRQIEQRLNQLEDLFTQQGKETQRAAVQRELERLNLLLDQTKAEIRNDSPRYAALTQPQPLKPAEMQELLDDETCLLQYAVGSERSYLWLITKKGIRPYTLPARAVIEKAIDELLADIKAYEPRESFADPVKQRESIEKRVARQEKARVTYPKRAFDLSNMVLKPLASRPPFKRVILVADGLLQYVPFSALPLPNEVNAKAALAGRLSPPLIASYTVVNEPSASVLALIRRNPPTAAPKTVAVIADPVFSKRDARVTAASKTGAGVEAVANDDVQYLDVFRDAGDTGSVGPLRLVRLKNSRKEAEVIVAVAPAGESMSALDFDATRAKALSEELKEFRIVHFATHGVLHISHPELSGLVFSLVDKKGDPARGFLRLNDIYNLNMPADLVVLSACETAIEAGPRIKSKSEGLTGLTRGFMYAGAARVVASLWKVDDFATAELMTRFYTYMLEKKMPASEALRQAQLDIYNLKEDWRPSFYWAGFALQGEWN